MEEQVSKIWSALWDSKRRHGKRDYLIATGPAPIKIMARVAGSRKSNSYEINLAKWKCCRAVYEVISKDIEIAIFSPVEYVREFAECIMKEKK